MDARGGLPSSQGAESSAKGPVDYQLFHGPRATKRFAAQMARGEPRSQWWLDRAADLKAFHLPRSS
jgi:hypothetical protein